MTRSAIAVHLYFGDRRTLSKAVDTLVTEQDRERAASTMHARRRVEHLAGRALLRHALGRHTGADTASFRIELTADGKPECVDGPAISLSHSGDFFVCAVADDAAVGVDIETGGAHTPPITLAERFFAPGEARWVEGDPEQRFFMLWVLKEAYLKALGIGLAGGLRSLECRIEPPAIVARVGPGSGLPQLCLLEASGVYVGVAVLGSGRLEVAVHRFSMGEGADVLGALQVIARTD